jgi:hypothetical protein
MYKIMGTRRKTSFLGENFTGLYLQEQEYMRNLIRSLFHLQNFGTPSAMEGSPADRLPKSGKGGERRRVKGEERMEGEGGA